MFFLKLCDVCDLLVHAMHGFKGAGAAETADQLEAAVANYLEAFKSAHGEQAVKFKHHQLLHIPAQIRRDKMLLSCFTLERKHISTKQASAHYKHAEVMPAGALARMVNAQVCVCVCVCKLMACLRGGVDRF